MTRRVTKEIKYVRLPERRIREIEELVAGWPYETKSFMRALPFGIPVLTIVMAATMLIQQKLQPPAGDPTQAKMMMMMPIVFTVIFINFSSGLVLYWLINNILSIAQQYYVSKKNA